MIVICWIKLSQNSIEMIAPYLVNRCPEKKTHDRRPLRLYKYQLKMERTIAWLGYHRHLLIGYENTFPSSRASLVSTFS
jgi:hypothetical protein